MKRLSLALIAMNAILFAQDEIAMAKCSRTPEEEKPVDEGDTDEDFPEQGPEDLEATFAPPVYHIPAQTESKPKPVIPREGAAKKTMKKEEAIGK